MPSLTLACKSASLTLINEAATPFGVTPDGLEPSFADNARLSGPSDSTVPLLSADWCASVNGVFAGVSISLTRPTILLD